MDWFDAIFTSEIAFFLHLPHFINIYETPTKYHPPKRVLSTIVFAVRLFLNVVTLLLWLYNKATIFRWILLIISTALYGVSYIYIRWHIRHNTQTPIQPYLYGIAQVSVINFLFDAPGRLIPTVPITHQLIILINVVCSVALYLCLTAVTDIALAWYCYPSEWFDVEDYLYGLCPAPGDSATDAPMCSAEHIKCSTIPIDTMQYWSHTRHYLINGEVVALLLYITSYPEKLAFWTEFRGVKI